MLQNTNTFYIDESNYLSYQKGQMIIGGFIVPDNLKKEVSAKIKAIKIKHGLKSTFELKWTKVSMKTLPLYIDVFKLMWEYSEIKIRIVIASKPEIRASSNYATWYTRLHYTLFSNSPYDFNTVLSDIKGGQSEQELGKTAEISRKQISYIDSCRNNIIQATDILIGAIHGALSNVEIKNEAKLLLAKAIQKNINLKESTPLDKNLKFNIFYWGFNA